MAERDEGKDFVKHGFDGGTEYGSTTADLLTTETSVEPTVSRDHVDEIGDSIYDGSGEALGASASDPDKVVVEGAGGSGKLVVPKGVDAADHAAQQQAEHDQFVDGKASPNEDNGEPIAVADEEKESTWRRFFLSWRGIVAAALIIVAVLLPVLWVKVVTPAMDKKKVAEMTAGSTAAIVPYKHSWAKVDLDKDKVDNLSVNTSQWLLHNNEADWSKSSCVVFHADGQTGKHKAKTTIAFGDSKSRDFFDSQAGVFEDGMRSGKIDLEVCMLLTDDEYSALAMEAFGEVDYNDPANSWQAIKNLLKVDVTEMKDSDARVDAALSAVKSIVNYDKKVDISEDSLKNGSFLQWSRVMTDAEKVEKIPAFWIDGENLSSQEKFKLSNPDVMHERIESLE